MAAAEARQLGDSRGVASEIGGHDYRSPGVRERDGDLRDGVIAKRGGGDRPPKRRVG